MSKTDNAPLIAVTGIPGSGKSTFCKYLEQLGARVVVADHLARRAVEPGTVGFAKIAAEFGAEVLNSDGTINRKVLGDIVFANSDRLRALERILHPEIRTLAEVELIKAQAEGFPLIVYDCPLFFEAGLSRGQFRAVVIVTCPEQLCLARLSARDALTESSAKQRIAAHMPQSEKTKLADIEIDNSLDLAELQRCAQLLFKKFTNT